MVCGFNNERKLEEYVLKLFHNKNDFNSNSKIYYRENLTKKLSFILDEVIQKKNSK